MNGNIVESPPAKTVPEEKKKPEQQKVNISPKKEAPKPDKPSMAGKVSALKTDPIIMDAIDEFGDIEKAGIGLGIANENLQKSIAIVENTKALVLAMQGNAIASPEELALLAKDPEMAEYAGQMYEIEKQKYDASQAMARNMATSLITQIFAGASGVKGAPTSAGADVFTSGANTMIAEKDKIDAQNNKVDMLNQAFAAKHNTNMLAWAEDYNARVTDYAKNRNALVYKIMKDRVDVTKEIIKSITKLSGQGTEAYKTHTVETTKINTKLAEIKSNQLISVLDNNTKIRIANLETAAKIKIANQVNDAAWFKNFLDAERLDRDEDKAKFIKFSNPNQTAAETMNAIGASGMLYMQTQKPINEKILNENILTIAQQTDTFMSALNSRMTGDYWSDPNLGGGLFGPDWETDGAVMLDTNMKLNLGGWWLSKKAWNKLASATSEDLAALEVDLDKGDVWATGDLAKAIIDLRASGDMYQKDYSKETRDTIASASAIAITNMINGAIKKADTDM